MNLNSQKLKGSEIVVKCLQEQGVEYVFSYPGGAVIPLFDAFYRMDHNIHQVEPCHEQNGIHAAEGYAPRLVGLPVLHFAVAADRRLASQQWGAALVAFALHVAPPCFRVRPRSATQ